MTRFSDPSPPSEDYNGDICVMNADGSSIVDLTNTPQVLEDWPSWGLRASSSTKEKR